MKIEMVEIEICQDCLVMIANVDPTGMDAERLAEWEHGFEQRWPVTERWWLVAGSTEHDDRGFRWSECDGCGALADDRFAALAGQNLTAVAR